MKKIFLILSALVVTSCGCFHHIPSTSTTINVRDSVAVHYIDSIRVIEATRYKDLAWLGDTLKLKGNRSRAWAYADTLKECIIGELQEDKVEEKVKYIFKDRIKEVHDTTKIEVPIKVEVEKVVAPKLYPWSLSLNALFLTLIGLLIYLKIKKR